MCLISKMEKTKEQEKEEIKKLEKKLKEKKARVYGDPIVELY